jgi:hypothetical protein
VTALGVFDETRNSGAGLAEAHAVGLWSGDGGSLLASLTVPSGTTGTLVPSDAFLPPSFPQGDWRFAHLSTPVTLVPGDYLIGAFYQSGSSDRSLNVNNLSTLSTLSGIDVTQGKTVAGAALTAPTQDESFGYFGPSFLAEQAIVNPDLTVSISARSTDTNPVAEGPAGVFSFTATYCNKSASPTLEALVSSTRVLTNGNSLVNRDRDGSGTPVGGVGSELDFPLTPDYDDGLLAATECVDVPYEIGLSVRSRFQFRVDLLGTEGAAP